MWEITIKNVFEELSIKANREIVVQGGLYRGFLFCFMMRKFTTFKQCLHAFRAYNNSLCCFQSYSLRIIFLVLTCFIYLRIPEFLHFKNVHLFYN